MTAVLVASLTLKPYETMLRYTGTTYGKVIIRQGHEDVKRQFTIDIRSANCLCAFVHVRKLTDDELKEAEPGMKYRHTLYSFLADTQHGKNIIRAEGKLFWDEVVRIDLNMAYKESWSLLKLFMASGYKVRCYNKPPKNRS